MIKNIVLDMGNVCCKWDVSYIASQLASSLEEKDYIIKHLFQTKQWAQLDQGVLSLQDAKKQLIEQIPDKKRDLIVYAFEHWFDYFDQFDEMEEFIKRYKGKGYQFYLLSNCSMQFYQYYQSKSIFQHFKELYTSAKYQKIKPRIFKPIRLYFITGQMNLRNDITISAR